MNSIMTRPRLPFLMFLDADCITFYAADICALIVYSAFTFDFVTWAIGIWRMSAMRPKAAIGLELIGTTAPDPMRSIKNALQIEDPSMSTSLRIREAFPQEADLLSCIALRSKAHWGYSKDFLDACRSELTVDASRFGTDDYQCFAAVDSDSIVGFYTLERISAGSFELEALFVEPEHIGRGVGRSLIQDAVRRLSERGAERLIIQGDPHATDFYLAAGAQEVGRRESGSIPGRELPLFEIEISTS